MDSLIAASIADMNQAVGNSGIVSVGIENVMPNGSPGLLYSYNENSNPPPNCFGSAPLCNYLFHRKFAKNNLATLRNTWSADLVILMVADTFLCGVAYTQRPNCGVDTDDPACGVGAAYNAFAYSVVSSSCSVTTRTFSHEVGHQFGMEHHRPASGGLDYTPSFPWSFGHYVADPAVQARTIMSYDVDCLPFGCPVYLHYSNPDINFLAYPGVASGVLTPNSAGYSAYNARTMTALAPLMSGFRGPSVLDRLFRAGFEALPLP